MARPPKSPKPSLNEIPADDVQLTPLMRQYYATKSKYPDALLLFRIGDFYETFGDDAVKASRALGIMLTNRNNGSADTELAGFPHHSLDTYLPKLVRAGYRVAICEQLEKPQAGKVVRRGVTEVITPGVATDDKLLEQAKNNFLAAVAVGKKDSYGLCFTDISTGEMLVTEGGWDLVDKLLQNFLPAEIIFAKSQQRDFADRLGEKYYLYPLDEWVFQEDYTREKLLEQFQTQSLKGFGVEELDLAQVAAGATLHYLAATENRNLQHITHISRLFTEKYVWLDRFTVRNLELITPNHEGSASLIQILDRTLSPMGARLMRKWVVLPLKTRSQIEARLDVVQYFIENQGFRSDIEGIIRQIGDLERLISKVPLGKINPREMRQLGRALGVIEPLQQLLRGSGIAQLIKFADGLNPCLSIQKEIENTIIAEPPVNFAKGGVIAENADAELDDLRNVVRNAQSLLIEIQQKESEKTGIGSLKIGFNNVFGYFLEVTAKYKHIEVPPEWIRKQTLANAERYITPELKVLEEKILGAEEKMLVIEERIFQKLLADLLEFIRPIQHNAQTVGVIDCLRAFAEVAEKQRYTRPIFNDGFSLNITDGRHPVIEQQLPIGETYVPNSVYLDRDAQQILMITGPNMAGKSALLRQTALICLMAQMGSFVPAEAAALGILDKVFTRVGASDNISAGESTFMVEMNETASIMNNVSDRSLILLDEIGRGTSTYDGISIAWSIAEYLHESPTRPKTLFATHYHELNELAEKHERIKNYHVATKEMGQKVIFLRKLTEGGSQHSFGIHVARMAGMPRQIVQRATDILTQLEQKHIENNVDNETNIVKSAAKQSKTRDTLRSIGQPMQLNFFDIADPRLQRIKDALDAMDLNAVTPIELMMKVHEWKKMLDS